MAWHERETHCCSATFSNLLRTGVYGNHPVLRYTGCWLAKIDLSSFNPRVVKHGTEYSCTSRVTRSDSLTGVWYAMQLGVAVPGKKINKCSLTHWAQRNDTCHVPEWNITENLAGTGLNQIKRGTEEASQPHVDAKVYRTIVLLEYSASDALSNEVDGSRDCSRPCFLCLRYLGHCNYFGVRQMTWLG